MEPPDEIRYGILAGSSFLPGWQLRCLEELDRMDGVRLELVILRSSGPERAGEAEGRRGPLFGDGLWERIRAWLAPETAAVARVSLEDRLADVTTLRCRPDGPGAGRFHPDDVERIRERDLDFILRLDEVPVRGAVLRIPTYGVWAFRHGEPSRHPPGPPGFWEILRGDDVTVGVLQRLTGDPGVVEVLYRGRFQTEDDSWKVNRDRILTHSSPWPARVCREILAGARTPRSVSPTCREIRTPVRPDGRQTLGLVGRLAWNYVRNVAAEICRHEQWSVGTVGHPPEAFVESGESLWVRWLPTMSRQLYRADPFGIQIDGTLRVMAEEFDYTDGLGRLVSLRIGRDGRPRPDGAGAPAPRGIPAEGDEPVHISYPYLFSHGESTYCVPETSEARVVRLYRARDFPSEWETVATLVEDFAAVDPTIFRYDDRWWLFCTDLDGGSHTHLHAWWASELTGPWAPHALNPLKTDVRSARPAGTPFRHHGALFRPAQDCSKTYGGAIALNRVVDLSPTRFRETTVGYLRPDPDGPYPDGLHTLSAAGDRTLVDGMRYVFVPQEFERRLRRRLRSVLGRWLPGRSGRGKALDHAPRDPGDGAATNVAKPALSRRPAPSSKPSREEGAAGRSSTPDRAGTSST